MKRALPQPLCSFGLVIGTLFAPDLHQTSSFALAALVVRALYWALATGLRSSHFVHLTPFPCFWPSQLRAQNNGIKGK